MRDPATYRRYAEECRRLAKTMPAENRHVLLEIARAWSDLAEEHLAEEHLAEEHQQIDPRSDGHELTKGQAD
jgi:hypothetical protein